MHIVTSFTYMQKRSVVPSGLFSWTKILDKARVRISLQFCLKTTQTLWEKSENMSISRY